MSLKPICLSVSRSYSLSCTELLDMLNSNSEWHKENQLVFSCQCVADTASVSIPLSSLVVTEMYLLVLTISYLENKVLSVGYSRYRWGKCGEAF